MYIYTYLYLYIYIYPGVSAAVSKCSKGTEWLRPCSLKNPWLRAPKCPKGPSEKKTYPNMQAPLLTIL